MTALPEWMRAGARGEGAGKDAPPAGRRRGGRALRGGLTAFLALVDRLLLDRRTAEGPGLLQRLDPRAKVLGLTALVVAASLVHPLPALLALLGLGALLAALSRVPAGRYAPLLLGAPLLSLLVALPAALDVVTPGRPVLVLVPEAWAAAHGLSRGLALTDAGLVIVARLVLRTAASVLFVVLLSATTAPERLLGGLRALGVPRLFVMLLSMMARYLEVLLRAASDLHLARLSRTLAPPSARRERALAASGVGALYRRTRALGEDVHLALVSRGFTGEPAVLARRPFALADAAFVALAVVAAALTVGLAA